MLATPSSTHLLDPDRVICSTITLRHLALDDALRAIEEAGFTEIDLGALPGVCNHVPFQLDTRAVRDVTAVVRASRLRVRSVNADIGDLNEPLGPAGRAERAEHIDRLIELATGIGATAIVLPNGKQRHDPVVSLDEDLRLVAAQLTAVDTRCRAAGLQLWVEAPHYFRLCHDLDRTGQLLDRLPDSVGVICDVSHIVASGSTPVEFIHEFGPRIRHVHLRDAEPGYIHHSIGNGQVDFAGTVAALEAIGYDGKFALELETRDIADAARAAAARRSGRYISSLFTQTPAQTPVRTAS